MSWRKPGCAGNLKIDPNERGPLSYIAGYIVSKLYQKTHTKKNKQDERLQELLESLKSTEPETPSNNLMGIVE